jgi:hypothetical protein
MLCEKMTDVADGGWVAALQVLRVDSQPVRGSRRNCTAFLVCSIRLSSLVKNVAKDFEKISSMADGCESLPHLAPDLLLPSGSLLRSLR